ncbi:MAG TPA: aromatic ring-hydroxylating dioxygenase subunit alpha, partial [Eoetvoesiella sp.]
KAIFSPAGTGTDSGAQDKDVFLMDSYNFMTPIDESNTRYYWFQMRNFSPSDQHVSQQFAEDVRHAFEEDRAVLTAVHQGMTHKRTPNINLPQDAGPLRFRRKLAELISLEQDDQRLSSPSAIASEQA